MAYVDETAKRIAQTRADTTELNGELITEAYLDSLAESINTELQEAGRVTIGHLATVHNFPVDYTQNLVKKRLGKIIQAQQSGNTLYTDAFVTRQTAKLRGVFRAITMPTSIGPLTKEYDFEEAMVQDVLPKLVEKGELPGTLKGKPAREYVPHIFADMQSGEIDSFFEQNNYFEKKRAKKLGIKDPHSRLKEKFADCVDLETVVIAGSIAEQLDGEIEEILEEQEEGEDKVWFVDAASVLPEVLTEADVVTLVQKTELIKSKQLVRMAEVFVVNPALLGVLEAKFKEEAEKAGEAAKMKGKPEIARSASADDDDGDGDEERGSSKGKKGKGKRGGEDSEEEDEGKGKKGKKGKNDRKKLGKRGKKGDDSSDEDDEPPPPKKGGKSKKGGKKGSGGGGSGLAEQSISAGEMYTLIERWVPALGKGAGELKVEIATALRPNVKRMYEEAIKTALSSILRGDAVNASKKAKNFDATVLALFNSLALLEPGTKAYKSPQAEAEGRGSLAEQYLLRTKGAALAEAVTSMVCGAANVPYTPAEAPLQEFGDPMTPTLTDEQRDQLTAQLKPASLRSAVIKLWTFATAGRQSLSDFMEHLETKVADEVVQLPPLTRPDKKTLKNLVFAHKKDKFDALGKATSPEGVLHLSLLLIFQQRMKEPLEIPATAESLKELTVMLTTGVLLDPLFGYLPFFADVACSSLLLQAHLRCPRRLLRHSRRFKPHCRRVTAWTRSRSWG
jgi:hypothetical protein